MTSPLCPAPRRVGLVVWTGRENRREIENASALKTSDCRAKKWARLSISLATKVLTMVFTLPNDGGVKKDVFEFQIVSKIVEN